MNLGNILDNTSYYRECIYNRIRYYLQYYYNIEYNASKINDNIYISDLPSSCNLEKLKEDGITHILCTVLGMDPIYPDDFIYKNIHLRDVEYQDLTMHFDECVQFIDDAIKQDGKVLVHCSYGVSRSASMVIAYFIKKGQMSYEEAYQLVKNKRDIIEPNDGFKKQLKMYQSQN